MKLALIPPIPNLSHFGSTGINLLLAPLMNDTTYYTHYRRKHVMGEFNILDNGAHENQQYNFSELLILSRYVCDEVVIPDFPYDSKRTLESFCEAIRLLNTTSWRQFYAWCGEPRLMFVPQMEISPGWLERYILLASKMIGICQEDTWLETSHFTLGLSLLYDTQPEVGLLEIVDRLSDHCETNGIPIHLLGWSRRMGTPIMISRKFPSLVRSVDTCKPFVYGRYGVKLPPVTSELHRVTTYPGRPSNYFTRKLTVGEAYLGNFNSNILQALIFDSELSRLPEFNSDNLCSENRAESGGHSPRLPYSVGGEEGDTPRR